MQAPPTDPLPDGRTCPIVPGAVTKLDLVPCSVGSLVYCLVGVVLEWVGGKQQGGR